MNNPSPQARRTRRWVRVLAPLGLALVLSVAGVWVSLYFSVSREELPAALPPEAAVSLAPGAGDAASAALARLPKQGPNQCGAYATAVGLSLVTGRAYQPEALVARVSHQLSWSEALSGNVPWRIIAALREEGLAGAAYRADGVPPARRLDLLRSHLARGHPVILLIESERGTQHYVLALGYGPAGLDIYDPNAAAAPDAPAHTADANGARPGNRSLSAEAVLELWSRGGIAGLYRWWYLPLRPARG